MPVMMMFIKNGQRVPKFIALKKLYNATAAVLLRSLWILWQC